MFFHVYGRDAKFKKVYMYGDIEFKFNHSAANSGVLYDYTLVGLISKL
jgi:hypothetical protein